MKETKRKNEVQTASSGETKKEIEITPDMEIIEERTEYAKVYDLGGGLRRMVVSQEKVHILEDGKLVDITCEIQGRKVTRCPYKGEILEDKIGYRIERDIEVPIEHEKIDIIEDEDEPALPLEPETKLRRSIVEIELLDIPFKAPVIEGNEALWEDVLPGVDVVMAFTPSGANFFITLKDENAQKSFDYRIMGPERMIKHLGFNGSDAEQKAIHLEQTEKSSKEIEKKDNGFQLIEKIISNTFLNEVTSMDEVTRKRSWSEKVKYPVILN